MGRITPLRFARMLEKTGLTAAARWLEDNFARLVAEHGVPGATVAVLAEGGSSPRPAA